MNTTKTTTNDLTLGIIQQLLQHNSQLLHASTIEDLLSYDTLETCFSDFIDYSEYPSVREKRFIKKYRMLPDLFQLLLSYCDEFINHPGAYYQWEKGNFYINIQWVKNTVDKVCWEYLYTSHSGNMAGNRTTSPFSGDYTHLRLGDGQYVFNYPHRDYQHNPNMMNINAAFQIFISDCLEGEKLYCWFYYYVCFLLFALLIVLVSGDMKNAVAWCNPRFSHRYAPLVFYSLQETQLSGLRGIVECNKSLLDWWEPIQHFYEDMVKVQCKRVKTV